MMVWVLRLARAGVILASAVGWGLAFASAITLLASSGHGIGVDSHAYWLAGGRVLAGEPLYEVVPLDTTGAYFYPPLFAQAWAPFSLVPEAIVAWLWRLSGLLAIRYMAGSWLLTGAWFLFPGTITELGAGNVTFQMAALIVAGLRGRAEGVLPAATTKYSAALVIPYVWLCRPSARRGLLVGAGAALGAIALSMIVDPQAWLDYFSVMTSLSRTEMTDTGILRVFPSAGADYAIRLAFAIIVAIASVWRRSPRLAYGAAFLATPTLWPQRFAMLLAVPTVSGDVWVRALLR